MTQPPEDLPQYPPGDATPPAYPAYPGETPTGGFGAPPPPPGYPAPPSGATQRFASWWERVAAYIIDTIAGAALNVVLVLIFGNPLSTTTNQVTDEVSFHFTGSAVAPVYGIGLIWLIVNWIYLQGTKGQTIGKMALGIAVYRAATTQPMGVGLAIGRYFARFLDVIPCLIGLLWPLWDAENRTFADMICGTRVYKL